MSELLIRTGRLARGLLAQLEVAEASKATVYDVEFSKLLGHAHAADFQLPAPGAVKSASMSLAEADAVDRVRRVARWIVAQSGRDARVSGQPQTWVTPAWVATDLQLVVEAAGDEPDDESAYVPATRAQEMCGIVRYRDLKKIVDEHNVRWRRPKTRDGRENPHRRLIHIGDLQKAMDSQPDPLDLPGDVVDQTVREAQKRQAKIRKQKERDGK